MLLSPAKNPKMFHQEGKGNLSEAKHNTGIWLIVNTAIFMSMFIYYKTTAEFEYLRHLIGDAFPCAKASATCINFNCMLVIFPICRNLLLFLSNYFKCGYAIQSQLWKNITYHKLIATAILFFSSIHVVAHCFSYGYFYEGNFTHEPLRSVLTHLPPNTTHLNPIQDTSHGLVYQTFKTVPGVTGIFLCVILFLIATSSVNVIRRSNYEIFWLTHHLIVLFYIILVFHGIQGIITKQINLSDNNPSSCSSEPHNWGLNSNCKVPNFASHSTQSWKWVLFPFCLYLTEKIIRFIRGWQSVTIYKIIKHPSSVLELKLHKKAFQFKTGQYIYIQCSSISFFEWHPFTLTSAPEDPYLSVHIRLAGNWTKKFINKFSHESDSELNQYPRLAIDGPYGTPSERVFDYKTVMLIGAGIGITPFASVLMSFLKSSHKIIENIHFFWLCPKPQSFEWFAELLLTLEQKLRNDGNSQSISYHIYLTSGWNRSQVLEIFFHDNEPTDITTGLQQKTNYGRPNWDDIFESIKSQYHRKNIGVFCCGPKSLSKVVAEKCRFFSEKCIQFDFYKENF
uniref:FAD-binding FR-type domain-containing protein n=1 Tax=Strigamia maritima TaxID=126957 RepID=T1IPL8_STRMM